MFPQLRRSIVFATLFLLLALLLTACPAVPLPLPVALPAAPAAESAGAAATLAEVTFVATEYAFDAPETLAAGWTRLTLDNQGALAHDLFLFKIEAGKTLDDVMAALEAEGPPEWAEFYGLTDAEGGASNWFVTNLTPGSYVYLSFGEAEDAPPDAAQGMIGTLTVTEATGPVAAEAPLEADATLQLLDYAFVVNGSLESGEQVLRVSNDGDELHEVFFMKLKEGKTFEDVQAFVEMEMSGEPMPEDVEEPADLVGGAFLSPGVVNYISQAFEAGDYILICFLPSPGHDMKPHFELGMIQQVTIE